jgi:CRP/FNR family transcriptional regulator
MYALSVHTSVCRRRVIPLQDHTSGDASLESLFRGQPAEVFSAGRAVFWQGDPAADLFEVTKGVLRLCRVLPEGKRVVAGFIYPGDLLGVAYRDRYLFTAEAVTDVTVRRFPRRRFDAIVSESTNFRPTVLAKLCDEMCAAQDQMLLLLHRSAEGRVASFLLTVARKTEGGEARGMEVHLPMSRTDIADYLGLTIETTCRCISKLKAEGLISLNGPHHVVLERPGGLRRLSGEEGPRAVS